MTSKTRIVGCQGSIQLAAAVNALKFREKYEIASNQVISCKNYLIIYDLFSPKNQEDKFVNFIITLANISLNWTKIVYIAPFTIANWEKEIKAGNIKVVFKEIFDTVEVDQVDEIYLGKDWQFTNTLLLNAFPNSIKICYGDSMGLYFTEKYFSPRTILNMLKYRISFFFEIVKFIESRLLRNSLGKIKFDLGYFLIEDLSGEKPYMKFKILPKEGIIEIFQEFEKVISKDYLTSVKNDIADREVFILMTSNFSESGKISKEMEIESYIEFLAPYTKSNQAILIIKPHPRDSLNKIEMLEKRAIDCFYKVISLTDLDFFFLPFETILLSLVSSKNFAPKSILIGTVSTACINIKLLFNIKPLIGFGEHLVKKYFKKKHVKPRILHENDLIKVMSQLK